MYNQKEKTEEIIKFAQTLKDNYFTVIVPNREEQSTWFFFFKDGYFGNVGCEYFSGYHFSTVHRPCTECGTGFGIEKEAALTIENANKCLMTYPNWATDKQRKAVRSYKDPVDFINATNNKWANYSIL